jgi:hypothetical protein
VRLLIPVAQSSRAELKDGWLIAPFSHTRTHARDHLPCHFWWATVWSDAPPVMVMTREIVRTVQSIYVQGKQLPSLNVIGSTPF